MERSLLKEMNRVDLVAFLNRLKIAKLKTMYWSQFFDLKPTISLNWTSLSGSEGAPVMADVVEYNASAPIKSRRVVAKATGDIPKIAIKRQMDEKDWNEYTILQALSRGDADKGAILDLVFNDTEFVYTGVLARTEMLALGALSYGQLALDTTNNNGKVTETAVNFGIPTGNKTAVGTIWATSASATPIANIRTKMAAIRADGNSCSYVVMDNATYLQMINCTEVQSTWAAYQRVADNKVGVPSLDSLNAMLTAERLPQILIVDSLVRSETKAGAFSNVSPWKTGYVTFIQDLKIGKILHGPIAEENSPTLQKVATMVKRDHVLITKWSQLEPFGEFTKGQANAFPIFNDVSSIYILKTNGTAWA